VVRVVTSPETAALVEVLLEVVAVVDLEAGTVVVVAMAVVAAVEVVAAVVVAQVPVTRVESLVTWPVNARMGAVVVEVEMTEEVTGSVTTAENLDTCPATVLMLVLREAEVVVDEVVAAVERATTAENKDIYREIVQKRERKEELAVVEVPVTNVARPITSLVTAPPEVEAVAEVSQTFVATSATRWGTLPSSARTKPRPAAPSTSAPDEKLDEGHR
jgi:hypothetical protein